MLNLVKKVTLGTALAASVLVTATPAMAQDYRGRHRDDNGTAIAVGAGILGIIAIAALASSKNRDCDGYRDNDRRCDNNRGGYYGGYNSGYNGGYNGGYNSGGYYRGGGEQRRRHHNHRDHARGYDQRD